MKGHHYIIVILLLGVGAWFAVKRGWLRKPTMPTGGAPAAGGTAGGEQG